MHWWEQAAAATQALFDQYGMLAIALFVLVEEAGVPIPIPVHLLVMTAARDAQAWAAEIEADGVVLKPFELDQLPAEVERLCGPARGPAQFS